MENFYLSISVVMPLFLLMALGFFFKRVHFLSNEFLHTLNVLCFTSFLPTVIFLSIYQTDVQSVFNGPLIIFALISIFIIFGACFLIIPIIEKDNARRGVMIQGISRSNYLLFGLPVVTSIFGAENVGVTAVLISFCVPLFNVLSIITLEVFRGNKQINFKQIIKSILRNPLILAAVFGFICLFLNIRFPVFIEKTISDVSKLATPLALMVLGATFKFNSLKRNAFPLIVTVGARLILVGLIFIPISIFLGYRGVELASLLALFASPVAVSSYTMAVQMDSDGELAGQIVVLTSIFSVITMFFWIFILSSLSLI